jgi:hypothetical protein
MKNVNQRKQPDKLELTESDRATEERPKTLKLLVLNKIAPGLRIMPLGIEKKNNVALS